MLPCHFPKGKLLSDIPDRSTAKWSQSYVGAGYSEVLSLIYSLQKSLHLERDFVLIVAVRDISLQDNVVQGLMHHLNLEIHLSEKYFCALR